MIELSLDIDLAIEFSFNSDAPELMGYAESQVHVTASCSGLLHALVYWFDLDFGEGRVFTTGQGNGSAWSTAAFIFEEMEVIKDREYLLSTCVENGSIQLSLNSTL